MKIRTEHQSHSHLIGEVIGQFPIEAMLFRQIKESVCLKHKVLGVFCLLL